MDRSFLDLLDEPTGKKKSSSKSANTADPTAPIELVTEFLLLLSDYKMNEALEVCNRILVFEPDNAMMKDYKKTIEQFISQTITEQDAKASAQESSDEDDEDDEDQDDESDEDSESTDS